MPLAERLALGAQAWDPLSIDVESASPFTSWAWHRAWADAAPADEVAASEAFVLRGSDGAVQAMLPVLLRRTQFHRSPVTALTWAVGDLGCPDFLDVPAKSGACVELFAPIVTELPWDVIVLDNVDPGAKAVHRLCDAIADQGHLLRRKPLWGCPHIEFGADWDAYLATLTASRRQTLHRKERSLYRQHTVAFTDYDGDHIAKGWAHLVRLHQMRWKEGGGGALSDERVVRLHQRFMSELAARRQLWLTTLDIDGEPAAAWYGFAIRDTVYFYQSGRDPRWERESVGLVLMGAMIRRAIERGYRRFEFLRGEDAYKRQWTRARRFTEQVTIIRRGWRGRWLRALDTAADFRARFRTVNATRAEPAESAHD
jgi:hypothetical protein